MERPSRTLMDITQPATQASQAAQTSQPAQAEQASATGEAGGTMLPTQLERLAKPDGAKDELPKGQNTEVESVADLQKQVEALQNEVRILKAAKEKLAKENKKVTRQRDAAQREAASAATTATATTAKIDTCETELKVAKEQIKTLETAQQTQSQPQPQQQAQAQIMTPTAQQSQSVSQSQSQPLAQQSQQPQVQGVAAGVVGKQPNPVNSVLRSYKLQLTATRDNLATAKSDYRVAMEELKDVKEQLGLKEAELTTSKASLAAVASKLETLGVSAKVISEIGAQSNEGKPSVEESKSEASSQSGSTAVSSAGSSVPSRVLLEGDLKASAAASSLVVEEGESCSSKLEAVKTELATASYDLKRATEQHKLDEEALQKATDELKGALAKVDGASAQGSLQSKSADV